MTWPDYIHLLFWAFYYTFCWCGGGHSLGYLSLLLCIVVDFGHCRWHFIGASEIISVMWWSCIGYILHFVRCWFTFFCWPIHFYGRPFLLRDLIVDVGIILLKGWFIVIEGYRRDCVWKLCILFILLTTVDRYLLLFGGRSDLTVGVMKACCSCCGRHCSPLLIRYSLTPGRPFPVILPRRGRSY
jgi:hypothetical protein